MPSTIRHPITCLRAYLGMAFGYKYFYSEREAHDLADTEKFNKVETGYQALQGTKPQTLAYGLSDSPVGLLGELGENGIFIRHLGQHLNWTPFFPTAWLLEKYHTWTDRSADPESLTSPNITRDDILAIITTYYITSTISSSLRIYYEFGHSIDDQRFSRTYVKAPVGVAVFKGELYKVGTWSSVRKKMKYKNSPFFSLSRFNISVSLFTGSPRMDRVPRKPEILFILWNSKHKAVSLSFSKCFWPTPAIPRNPRLYVSPIGRPLCGSGGPRLTNRGHPPLLWPGGSVCKVTWPGCKPGGD